jgi:predicted GIY-YIG superfamily endonuclease
MKNYYVYKFSDKFNDVLYVGLTTKLETRIEKQHLSKNESEYKVDWMSDIKTIEYTVCASLEDMKLKERYFINVLQPKHNKHLNKQHSFSFHIPEDWQIYDKKKKETQLEMVYDDQVEKNYKQPNRSNHKVGHTLFSLPMPQEAYETVHNLIKIKLNERRPSTFKSFFLEGLELLKEKYTNITTEENVERRFYKGGRVKRKVKFVLTSISILKTDVNWIDNFIHEQMKENVYYTKQDFMNVLILEVKLK